MLADERKGRPAKRTPKKTDSKPKRKSPPKIAQDNAALRSPDQFSFEAGSRRTPKKPRAPTPRKVKVENPEEVRLTPSQKRSMKAKAKAEAKMQT